MSRVFQIFTLNVDSFLTRAFSEVNAGFFRQLFEYDGFSAADSISFLARDNYCLFHLHGQYTAKSLWIMSADERGNLIKDTGGDKYKSLICRLFQNYNVVFFGVNPTDIAVSPFLRRAVELGSLSKHFWICPDPGGEEKSWAQNNNVRIIQYLPVNTSRQKT